MEQPKKPIKLSLAQREFLKLKIAEKAKSNPEFKKIVDAKLKEVSERKLKNNEDKEKD